MQKQKNKQQSKPIQSLSFEQLFQMAEEKFEELDYEQAQYFYGLAYNKNSFYQAAVMCYANVLKQNQKDQQAKKVLQKSIKQQPNGTHKRYFELAEIYHGVEAIKIFQAGIESALNNLKNPFKSVTPEAQIKRDVAQAYSSIAEICMTDLLDEPEAEGKCIQALQKGKNIDNKCMDVHLQIANYQLFKQNQDIARAQLNIIYEAVKNKLEDYESDLILQAAKYFIELEQFLKSQQLLEVVHEQQANESEIVYLLAYCTFKAQKYQECEQYIQEFQQGQNNIKDEQIQDAMKQLIEQLKKIKQLHKVNNGEGMDQTGENQQFENEQQEWMDVEDEEN